MSDQISFLMRQLPNLLVGFPGYRPGGLLMSLLLAGAAIGLGFILAILISTGYESRFRPLRLFVHFYVHFFRGIPLILLLLIVHQLLGNGRKLGLNRTPLTSALVALTFYSSAYQAAIMRAGLQAVPERFVDAGRLLGGSPWQVYRMIKLRFALRVMLPAFVGQGISLFKDTSVVIILGVAELMTVAHIALGSDVGNAPYWVGLFLVVGLLYFTIAFSLSHLAQHWEKPHHVSDLVYSLANYY